LDRDLGLVSGSVELPSLCFELWVLDILGS
jgi:hypothetical protein